jgi:hypothetical protein
MAYYDIELITIKRYDDADPWSSLYKSKLTHSVDKLDYFYHKQRYINIIK